MKLTRLFGQALIQLFGHGMILEMKTLLPDSLLRAIAARPDSGFDVALVVGMVYSVLSCQGILFRC